MTEQYFVKRGETVKGPFSLDKLQSLLAAKKLKANDLIGTSDGGPWERMTAVHKSIRAGQPLSLPSQGATAVEELLVAAEGVTPPKTTFECRCFSCAASFEGDTPDATVCRECAAELSNDTEDAPLSVADEPDTEGSEPVQTAIPDRLTAKADAVAPSPAESTPKTVACIDCGGIVSRRAHQCPHCGAPVDSATAETASEDDEYGYGDDNEYDYGDSNDIDLSDEFHDAPTVRTEKLRGDLFESESLGIRLRVTAKKLEIGKQIFAVEDIESVTVEDFSSQVRNMLWQLCLGHVMMSGLVVVLVMAIKNEPMVGIILCIPVILLWGIVGFKHYVWWQQRHMDAELIIIHDEISRIRGTHEWCSEAYDACRQAAAKPRKATKRGSAQSKIARKKLQTTVGATVVVGTLWFLLAFFSDTTVSTGMGRVHNIGKMQSKNHHMIFGGLIVAGGFALAVAGGKKE